MKSLFKKEKTRKMRRSKERFYFVYFGKPCYGYIVKARSVQEARKKGYKFFELSLSDDYLYVRARWLREADPKFLERFNKGDYYDPPSCEHCGSYFLNEQEMKLCPVCENGKYEVDDFC